MKFNGPRWTPAEDAQAVADYQDGRPIADIAARLGRSEFGIGSRLTKLRDQGKLVLQRRPPADYCDPYTISHYWTTDREIAFIENLGRHSVHGVAVGRRALLAGYVQSLPRRDLWGVMNRDIITKTAYDTLLEATLAEELIDA